MKGEWLAIREYLLNEGSNFRNLNGKQEETKKTKIDNH